MSVLKAVERGDFEYVRKNVFSDGWFKSTPWSDYILVRTSIQYNQPEITNLLLEKCFRVNCESEKPENTPLHYAVLIKNVELIQVLLNKGALADVKNAYGDTPVHLAAKSNEHQLVNMIFPYVKLNENSESSNKEGLTYMHIACMSGNVSVVTNFLKGRMSTRCSVHKNSHLWPGCYPLHCAIYNNQVTIANLLLEHGADPDLPDANGVTPLHLAFKRKHESLIALMLRECNAGKVNRVDSEGISYFHIICSLDIPERLEKYRKGTYDINGQISFESPFLPGYTPLHVAVHFGAYNTVAWLLMRRVDFTKCNKDGFSPLHMVFWRKEFNMMDLFMAQIPKTDLYNIPADARGLTFFHIACVKFNQRFIQDMIDRGTDVNAPLKKTSEKLASCTPLHIATRFENLCIVNVLLRNNANIHAVDINGETPLHYLFDKSSEKLDLLMEVIRMMYMSWKHSNERDFVALKNFLNNTLKILRLLIEHNVNVNVKNASNETPLFHLFNYKTDVTLLNRLRKVTPSHERRYRSQLLEVINECRYEMVKMMLPLRPDFKLKDERQFTLLHHLAARLWPELFTGHEVAQLLIECGADVDAKNALGETPLFMAATNGFEKLVNVLLLYGADVNAQCALGTPLSAAVGYLLHCPVITVPRIVSKLMMFDAEVDAVLPNGQTVLHQIFGSGKFSNMREFKFLSMSDCNLNVQEQDTGMTPLHYATEVGEIDAVDFLLYGGAKIDIKDNRGLDPVDYCLQNPEKVGHVYYNHFRRLALLGCRFSPSILDKLATLKNRSVGSRILPDKYFLAEIEKLKSCSINPYTTLYDILFKSVQELSKYVNNIGVHELLSRPNFCYDLPLYGSLIAGKYRKALLRYMLVENSLDTAMCSLNTISGHSLPGNVSEKILGYMLDNDVRSLISISKPE